jgi:CheY-like chemotaxis protein
MFSSRVLGDAQLHGWHLECCPTVARLLARLEELTSGGKTPALLLIDLAMPDIVWPDFAHQVRKSGATFPWIAYGPHVREEQLSAAVAAGCTEVLTRGQFNATFPLILRRYLGN